jgi:hypothetical protein
VPARVSAPLMARAIGASPDLLGRPCPQRQRTRVSAANGTSDPGERTDRAPDYDRRRLELRTRDNRRSRVGAPRFNPGGRIGIRQRRP